MQDVGANVGLVCPKCQGTMSTHARNGVEIEQCERCRGLFLDLGEFERLLAAESSFLGQGSPTPGRTIE